jgi:hypothetical protein
MTSFEMSSERTPPEFFSSAWPSLVSLVVSCSFQTRAQQRRSTGSSSKWIQMLIDDQVRSQVLVCRRPVTESMGLLGDLRGIVCAATAQIACDSWT